MKLELFDVKELIKTNNLQEVTSPVLFERGGIPNPKGLLSNEIFGVNVRDRKETFAYIDLHGKFFNPHVYKVVQRLYRNIDKIINGEMYVKIVDGNIVEDPKGETGLPFLYKNWEKIKWEKTKGMRNERVDLLNNSPKNHIFMDYQIVNPPFFRDISSTDSGGSTSEVNTFYTKIIRLTSLLEDGDMFDFSFHTTNYNIQKTIVEIYNYFKGKLHKKTGIFRKYLMGKSIDFCVRSVIVGSTFHGERPDDNMISFKYTGVPLSQCCVLMNIPMIHWLRNFFNREFIQEKFNKPVYDNRTGDITTHYELDSPESYFNDSYIKKAMNRFIKDPSSRFQPIEIPIKDDKKRFLYMTITGKSNDGVPMTRPMTWTDLLFLAATEVAEGKHFIGSRYPINSVYGTFITRIRVLSTARTIPMEIEGKLYKWYPVVDTTLSRREVSTLFLDCITFSNSYLTGLDGDYDGDQITCKVVWSVEANEEAEVLMHKKINILSITGRSMRRTENETTQTLYTLTRNPKKSKAV